MKAVLASLAATLFSTCAVAGTTYSFEELAGQRHKVPAVVDAMLRNSVTGALEDCQKQLGFGKKQMESYFTSKAVELPGSTVDALLVVPTQYCYAFFGAHAVAFWLFLIEPSGPRLVLASTQDALEVKNEGANGLPNVSTYYGTSETKYQYNGQQYVSQPE